MTSGPRTMVRNFVRTTTVLTLLVGCHRGTAATEPKSSNAVIPRDAARFSIASTNDSMVTFNAAEVTWLRVGMRGHAVDPARRDALIARLTIVRVDTAGVTASITGQVSQVGTTHVVLVARPRTSWWHQRLFWTGATAGAALGAAVAVVAR